MFSPSNTVLALLGTVSLAHAAQCIQERNGGPSVDELKAVLEPNLALMCQRGAGIGQGGIGVANTQGYKFSGSSDNWVPRNVTLCEEAYKEIYNECVLNGNFYGGEFYFANQLYQIANGNYPDTPLSGAMPTGTIPNAFAPTYTPLQCGDVSLNDLQTGAAWEPAKANIELYELVDKTYDANSATDNFDYQTSQKYGGPNPFRCRIIDSACDQIQACDDVTSPVGFMILNSLANFHDAYTTMHKGLGDAVDQFDLIAYADVFSPAHKSPKNNLKMVVDALSIILGVTNAGLGWVAGVRAIGGNGGKDIDKSAAAITALITGSFTLAKDMLPTEVQNDMSDAQVSSELHRIIQILQDQMADYSRQLTVLGKITTPDGTTVSLADLFAYGAWLSPDISNREVAVYRDDFAKIMNSAIVNSVWSANGDNPRVIRYSFQRLPDAEKEKMDFANTGIERDGSYWLLKGMSCNGNGDCNFYTLPGGSRAVLTGDPSVFGGMTVDDMLIATADGVKVGGPRYRMPELSMDLPDGEKGLYPFSRGVRTPGFFGLEVVSIS